MGTTSQQPDLDVYAVPVESGVTDDRTGKNVDLRTFETGDWSHSLRETGAYGCDLFEGKYGWCYCFVLAQIESRIGKASYTSALVFHLGFALVAYVLVFAGFIAALALNDTMSDSSTSLLLGWAVVTAVYLIIWGATNLYSLTDTRSVVRERFQIPEGALSDCFVMRRRTVRGLRQMALHLKIDKAGVFDRVDTLPAYDGQ